MTVTAVEQELPFKQRYVVSIEVRRIGSADKEF